MCGQQLSQWYNLLIICNEIGWLTSYEYPTLIKGSKADDPLPVFSAHPSILFDQSLNLSNTPHMFNTRKHGENMRRDPLF